MSDLVNCAVDLLLNNSHHTVVPAQAGTQRLLQRTPLGPRLRGDDDDLIRGAGPYTRDR